jgi:hypothetical protein
MISIFCKYNISNTYRRTALYLRKITNFKDEQAILILRYAAFTIKSLEQMDHSRRITICFDELTFIQEKEWNFDLAQTSH